MEISDENVAKLFNPFQLVSTGSANKALIQ